jgi:hypothetical protein
MMENRVDISRTSNPRAEVDAYVSGFATAFISWGTKHGILTAEHVVNPPNVDLRLDNSGRRNQRLFLDIDGRPSSFGFEASLLATTTFGVRQTDHFGPDLAVITLPESPELGTLKAKKCFWSLCADLDAKLRDALVGSDSLLIVGHAEEDKTSYEDQGIAYAPRLSGRSVQSDYFEHNGFDYLELAVKRDTFGDVPISFAGVSGGSLWRLWTSDVGVSPAKWKLTFAGVPFLQYPPGLSTTIRSHGPRSLYSRLLPLLETP